MCLGIPARVIRIEDSVATVAIGEIEYNASLLLIDDVKEGDYIILHAGFAIEKVDPAEALETIKLFREIEEKGVA